MEDKSLISMAECRAFQKQNPTPDKETDDMAWVRHMDLLREMSEDVVVREVVCT